MSLKVVLADESSTIKKVFQLALQDFAVEVFTAHTGEDVVEICSKTTPDIIFIDTLLQKKSGYKVCAELKKNSHFISTPIVLMWSSFVELDNDKFLASRADSQIEKPFDVQNLRDMVKSLVPKINEQEISNFLQMPDIDIKDDHHQLAAEPQNSDDDYDISNIEDFTEIDTDINIENDSRNTFSTLGKDDFEQVDLNISLESKQTEKSDNDLFVEVDNEAEPNWVSKTLSGVNTKYNISPDLDDTDGYIEVSELEDKINTVVNQQIKSSQSKNTQFVGPEIQLNSLEPNKTSDESSEVNHSNINISEEKIEQIITQIATPIIEKVIWKVVPEIATQLIEKELNRLINKKTQQNETY